MGRAGLFCALACAAALAAAPVPVIFDTDMGNDVDDALALAMLHALQSAGECEILAVVNSKDNRVGPLMCDVINTFYGRPEIPIGEVKGSGAEQAIDRYAGAVCSRKDADGRYVYPRRMAPDTALPDSVKVMRRALAEAEDNSVVICITGFLTNAARLLISLPDEISPLSGKGLLAKKGKFVSLIAGEFSGTRGDWVEYNIRGDKESAREFIRGCPLPIVFCGDEVGNRIRYPWASVMKDFEWAKNHPIKESVVLYRGGRAHDRPMWDLCSILQGVRPQAEYFELTEPGTVAVSEAGQTAFTPSPDGKHRVMKRIDAMREKRLVETFITLVSRPCDRMANR